MIEPETVRNNENLGDAATEFESFNYYNATAPVLESVKEDSQVRFKVNLQGVNASEVSAMVKVGANVIAPDESGYYSIDVTDSNVDVNVYAVPRNGATLNPAEVDMINPAEAKDVTSISFAGDVDSDKLKEVIDEIPRYRGGGPFRSYNGTPCRRDGRERDLEDRGSASSCRYRG